jgi:hypothetical protein
MIDKLKEEMDRLLDKYVIRDERDEITDCFFWDDVITLAKEYAEFYHTTIPTSLHKEQYRGRPNPRDVNPYDSKAIERTQRRKTH